MARRKVDTPEPAGEDVQPTPAHEWRKPREQGEVVTFVTGRSARLQAVTLSALIREGKIPDTLTPFAAAALYEGRKPHSFSEKWPAKDVEHTEALLNTVCVACWMEPKVVNVKAKNNGTPLADDEISVDDIDVIEKEETLEWATAPASTLRQFRKRQERSLAALRSS